MTATKAEATTAAATEGWFWRLFKRILQNHAKNINLEFFQRKYPGLPVEVIAARRIKAAAKYAGMVGFASGAIISVASLAAVTSAVGTVASGLLTSPVTVPALAVSLPVGFAAFAGEISLLIRIQLHLAYDLFVLYDLPINVEDPEQMQDVVAVAFGIKGTEMAGQAVQKILPQIAPRLLRNAMRTGLVRRKVQEWVARRVGWQFARRYLGEGVLIRAIVPGIAIVTAAGWDYTSTKAIGTAVQAKIRKRGLAAKEAIRLPLEDVKHPKILLQAALAVALTNEDVSETELVFYSKLVERLRHILGDEAIDCSVQELSTFDWEIVLADLVQVTDIQERKVIYRTLLATAVVEGELQRKKRQRLRSVAKLYQFVYDEKKIKARLLPFVSPKPTRTCLLVVLMVAGLMLFSCLICSLSFWLPPAQ